jgi:hypothetical protein
VHGPCRTCSTLTIAAKGHSLQWQVRKGMGGRQKGGAGVNAGWRGDVGRMCVCSCRWQQRVGGIIGGGNRDRVVCTPITPRCLRPSGMIYPFATSPPLRYHLPVRWGLPPEVLLGHLRDPSARV